MKSVIFDMDGVVSDTQTIQAKFESIVLKKYGINLEPDEISKKYAGMAVEDWFTKEFDKANKSVDVEKAIEEKWKTLFKMSKGKIRPIEGIYDLLNHLKNNYFKLAIASASRRQFIDLVIKELKLEKIFDALVSSTEVKKGKPAPDIFLLAANKLEARPEDCVVIEDGISGMEAAKKAGMKCIGLVNDKNGNFPADILVSSLSEIKIDYFK